MYIYKPVLSITFIYALISSVDILVLALYMLLHLSILVDNGKKKLAVANYHST